MITVSVIIPCFNAETTLGNCLQSILASSHLPDEILIIDDCSFDRTNEIAANFIRKYPNYIKYLRLNTNSGPARARNAGVEIASSKYIFFADSDTEFLTNTLSNFLSSIQLNNADAVVGIYDSTPINDGICQRYKAYLNFFFFSRLGIIQYEVFDSSRAGIKKAVFIQAGGFNSNLKAGMDYENEEFGYRLIDKYRLILDPSIRVKHHFPGFAAMTKTYFFRVALWAKLFYSRKKFESGGVTSTGTGLSSICLPTSLIILLLDILFFRHSSLFFTGLAFTTLLFSAYVLGYLKFFIYIYKLDGRFVLQAISLNIFFTTVITMGAIYGFVAAFLHSYRINKPSS
jgi:glycosyltransferase involved in cell wall biosynthesis